MTDIRVYAAGDFDALRDAILEAIDAAEFLKDLIENEAEEEDLFVDDAVAGTINGVLDTLTDCWKGLKTLL
jgi:hypothetical protein